MRAIAALFAALGLGPIPAEATSSSLSLVMSSARQPPTPRLVVFDLDACLWTPEMFELSGAPTAYSAAAGGVQAGSDVVRLFPGALAVLQRILVDKKRFAGVQVAVASSTTCPDYANRCLDELVVDHETQTTVGQVVSYREIFPGSKGRQHFPNLKAKSGISFDEMAFWDDCIYGDNCGDVAHNCPGVVCVRTPRGLTLELFEHALSQFAAGQAGVV